MLNLPPGWELVHASGVDQAPGTLVDKWTLLSFFALLIISAAIGQVMGWRYGMLAFVAVGLHLARRRIVDIACAAAGSGNMGAVDE